MVATLLLHLRLCWSLLAVTRVGVATIVRLLLGAMSCSASSVLDRMGAVIIRISSIPYPVSWDGWALCSGCLDVIPGLLR